MKEYKVEYRCWASVFVDAENFDEAIKKAEEKWYHAFTSDETGFFMEYGEPYYVENEVMQKYLD